MRALAAILLGAVALAAAARPAAAHPYPPDRDRILIVDDRPPPPPPPPPPSPPPKKPHRPLPTAVGFRFGATFAGRAGGFGFGLQGGLSFSTALRGIAEYEYVLLMNDDGDDPMPPAGTPVLADGSGHRGRLGLRVNLADTTLKDAVRFYVDADATAGLAVLHGPRLGRTLVPEVALGLRLGYELMARSESPSPSKWFDAHLLFRLVRTDEDTGMMFGVGMEWGK